MKRIYQIFTLYFLSALFTFALAATCSTITFDAPADPTGWDETRVFWGADQAGIANATTVECAVAAPTTTVDCTTCGVLGGATPVATGFFGLDACNTSGGGCAAREVGAMPLDPTPVTPAPVTGAVANP